MGAGLPWRLGTVTGIRAETKDVATLMFEVPGWPGHVAGQHLDLQLTAPDGYQAQRSYSIASAPEGSAVEITVERIAGGEVSPFLLGEVRVGDKLELRGPLGGYFTWQPGESGSLQLVAGGSGIVPLMAMIRHRARAGDTTPTRLLYSARHVNGIIYRQELDQLVAEDDGLEVTYTLTREQPSGWTGENRRIDRSMLDAIGFPPESKPLIFVCGPTPMVEQASSDLVQLGHGQLCVKTERFGPTGDIK